MIKDILVNLPVGQLSDNAVNYAVSVAVVFDAHLTGVAFVDEPFVPGTVFRAIRLTSLPHTGPKSKKLQKPLSPSSRMPPDAPAFRPLRRC